MRGLPLVIVIGVAGLGWSADAPTAFAAPSPAGRAAATAGPLAQLVALYAGLSEPSKQRAWRVLQETLRHGAPPASYAAIADRLTPLERWTAKNSGVPSLYTALDGDQRARLVHIIDEHQQRHVDPRTALRH